MAKKKSSPLHPVRAVSAALDIPPEVALGTLRLCLEGRERVTALNHRGILLYQPERIVFRCLDGAVAVSGRDLTLAELTEEELTIQGHISGLALRSDADA